MLIEEVCLDQLDELGGYNIEHRELTSKEIQEMLHELQSKLNEVIRCLSDLKTDK